MADGEITLTLGLLLIFPTDYATELIPHKRRRYIEIRIYKEPPKGKLRSLVSRVIRKNYRVIKVSGFGKIINGTNRIRRTRIALYKLALRRGKSLVDLRIIGIRLVISHLGIQEAKSLVAFLLGVWKRGRFRSFLKELITLLILVSHLEREDVSVERTIDELRSYVLET